MYNGKEPKMDLFTPTDKFTLTGLVPNKGTKRHVPVSSSAVETYLNFKKYEHEKKCNTDHERS